MTRCLISVTEETMALAVSLRIGLDEQLDSVIRRALTAVISEPRPTSHRPPPSTPRALGCEPSASINSAPHSVTLFGRTTSLPTKQDVLATVLGELSQRDPSFLERFGAERGRTRRFVSRSREALYPGSPHLATYARQLAGGWWMATNFSERDIERAVTRACDVAGVGYGQDVSIIFRKRLTQSHSQRPTVLSQEHRTL
jgi:hypothetical protein